MTLLLKIVIDEQLGDEFLTVQHPSIRVASLPYSGCC
jgi:hypothetical protein